MSERSEDAFGGPEVHGEHPETRTSETEEESDSVKRSQAGDASSFSACASETTELSVAIGAMSDSSDKTVLGNRGGYEDVVVEIPTIKEYHIDSWDIAFEPVTPSKEGLWPDMD